MNQKRLPIGVLVIIPVLIGMGVYAFTGQEPVAPAPGSEAATAEPSATPMLSDVEVAERTQQALDATATYEASQYPTPVPEVFEHGVFHNGALVQVTTGDGDCLNARWSPSVSVETSGVNVCLPEGYTGMLSGVALESDSRWWWYMAGAGYVAEEYLTYVGDADLRSAMAPQYANIGGHIAFMRDNGAIWVMRPDGSEQRQLVAAIKVDGYDIWPTDFNWSPVGTRLSYNITRWITDGTSATTELHVVDLSGADVAVFENVAGRFWSPDGSRIAVVSTVAPDGASGGWQQTFGYADQTLGGVRMIAQASTGANAYVQDLPSFNHDGTLILISYGWWLDDTTREDGFVIVDATTGAEVRRVASTTDYYRTPTWSPNANLIALEGNPGDGSGGEHAIYDLASGTFTVTSPEPAVSQTRGGGCGAGMDMPRVSWSRDGSRIHFGWMFGDAGTNGIWTLDVASGATSLLPVANSYYAFGGPGTLAVFADYSHIFIGDTAGGYPTLITDGRSPVWSSGQ